MVTIEHHHFKTQTVRLSAEQLTLLGETGTYRLGELTLERQIGAGFWAATVIFLAMLLIIALEKLHSTTAALAGMSAVFVVTFVGGAFLPDFYIYCQHPISGIDAASRSLPDRTNSRCGQSGAILCFVHGRSDGRQWSAHWWGSQPGNSRHY